jgi:hypothetical protein
MVRRVLKIILAVLDSYIVAKKIPSLKSRINTTDSLSVPKYKITVKKNCPIFYYF